MVGLVLLSAAVPIALIYLVFSHFRLKSRIEGLERRIRHLETAGPRPDASGQAPKNDVPPKAPESEPELEPKPEAAGPWARPADPPPPITAMAQSASEEQAEISRDAPPRSFVFRQDLAERALEWAVQNWHLAIAALSLALAGVFLVQYGVENGLLTPFWRVASAVALGAALIIGGEFLRRRSGDDAASHTAFLPSTFAGAGLVALFAAVISARQLYGLIGPEFAFAALVAICVLAVALGWFYGPFLAIVGIVGATASPFLVGGSSDTPQLFFYYFALITIVGFLIDAVRRWAWTSVVTLIVTHAAAWAIFMGEAGDLHYLGFGLVTAFAAASLLPLRWRPAHEGTPVLASLLRRAPGADWPEFPTRIAFAAHLGAVGAALLVVWRDTGQSEVWAAIAALALLFLAAAVWNRGANALVDLSLAAPIALIASVVLQGDASGALYTAFHAPLPPESPWPKHASVLALIALTVSALAFWRASMATQWRMAWTGGAALTAPVILIALEVWWRPAHEIGYGLWALHAMVVAAVKTLFAERCIRADGTDKRRAAMLTLAALTMISFALIVVLSSAALTVALAVMVLLAVVLDRWLGMAWLSLFVQIGAVAVGWRLIFDPGLFWAESAPLWELWLAFAPAIALQSVGWFLLRPLPRPSAKLVLESAVWMQTAVFAALLTYRWLGGQWDTHWGVGLFAVIGLIAMGGQLYRMKAGGWLKIIRILLACFYAVWGFVALAVVVSLLNPLFDSSETVLGPPVFDTLLLAFGAPAAVLAFLVWKLDPLHRWLRIAFAAMAAALSASYVALEIRRMWRGDILAVPGTSDPELYSYTVAMLCISVTLLFIAFARRSILLRRIAMIGVGLTIAKVFLIDMDGLSGLVRVASFLGLGLALAALAWINRRMTEQWEAVTVPEETP